ncbi:protein FAM227B-like isoform X2 [Ptychodera flava]|uniref:protein FAM227B-like isoform X2 n=1 Tax=Ptychodera flava TaxID=63121 RepID=UPI00396A6548
MASLLDPKVLALMAKVEGQSPNANIEEEERKKKAKKDPPPPNSVPEWMKSEGFDEWPVRVTSEGQMDLEDERQFLGSKDDIVEELRKHAPIPVFMLDNLEDKLGKLEAKLNIYASEILTPEPRTSRIDQNLFHSPQYVMAKAVESNAVQIQKGRKKKQTKDLKDQILGTKTKSIENCFFPGFNRKELTELPHQLESPQILDRVTQAQDYNPGFKKFWKKLFLSEASVAVMQDAFWWFFLENYETDRKEEQDKLFNRISDSFVALFTSVNPDIKDKFFAAYADCLAQSIYAAYFEAFPDSHDQLDDVFKLELCDLCHEWVSGVKPQPLSWRKWKTDRLQPKHMTKEKEDDKRKVVLLKDGQVNKDASFAIDFELPEEIESPIDGQPAMQPGFSREVTQLTGKSGKTPANVTHSRMTAVGLPPPKIESHEIGPGPDFERVHFNISGRSPLVAHYLYMKDLATNEHRGKNVRRTEVSKLPPPAPTYREVIKDTKKLAKTLHTEYQKISEQTAKELAAIEKQKAEQVREIEKIRKQLIEHSIDMKILSEKILDKRGMEGLLSYFREITNEDDLQIAKPIKQTAAAQPAVTFGENWSSSEDERDE